jgi:hypothetical protein
MNLAIGHARNHQVAPDRCRGELRELPHALLCPRPNAPVAGLRNGTIQLSRDRGQTWDALATTDGVRALV